MDILLQKSPRINFFYGQLKHMYRRMFAKHKIFLSLPYTCFCSFCQLNWNKHVLFVKVAYVLI